jgi:hypothetical protein
MSRREFTRNQREAIRLRATNAAGEVCCEKCGMVLTGKKREIDHIIPEALRPEADKRKPLTISDGQLLGECCHRGPDGKTAADVKKIAKGKRQNSKQFDRRIVDAKQAIPTQPFPITRKRADKLAKRSPKPPVPNNSQLYRAWKAADTGEVA